MTDFNSLYRGILTEFKKQLNNEHFNAYDYLMTTVASRFETGNFEMIKFIALHLKQELDKYGKDYLIQIVSSEQFKQYFYTIYKRANIRFKINGKNYRIRITPLTEKDCNGTKIYKYQTGVENFEEYNRVKYSWENTNDVTVTWKEDRYDDSVFGPCFNQEHYHHYSDGYYYRFHGSECVGRILEEVVGKDEHCVQICEGPFDFKFC